MRSYFVINV